MDHIVNIAHRMQQEIDMAKAKLAQPLQEVAQIVVYMTGNEQPVMVRYHDMKEAQKQYGKLLEAADHGRPCVLTSGCHTAAFRFPQNIAIAYLIDVDTSNFLMADSQKRVNAMMQLP
jgi:hypothetical protein